MTNISRSKGNRAIKLGQLIEYRLINIFLEESYPKCGGETIPRPFFKNQNWTYLWISIIKFYIFCFHCLPSSGLSKLIETKLKTTCIYLPASFSARFLKKNISLVILFYLTKFQCLVVFTSWDIGQYVYCTYLLTRLWRHRFWN